MLHPSAASVLLAGVLACACGSERARAPADRASAPASTTRYVDERRGYEVTFPSAWRRARRVLTPALWEPREILSVGTVRPVANGPASRCAQHATAAMGRLGPRDVFLTIQERTNQVSSEMEPGPPRLVDVTPDDSELPACLGHEVPFETYWMPFRSGARGFYANAAIGDDVSSTRRAQVQQVLDSLRFRGR